MGIIEDITKDMIRNDIPDFWVGDTVKVHQKIKEGNKERVQIFEGVVIGRKGGGISESFCVRKVSDGISIEKIFPLNSPTIAKIEVASRGKVRRAKLYYLRTAKGKKAKIERKIIFKKVNKKEE
ncbi:MAG: 50S ribosomal protein L19 [Caldisericia bacterium]|jgi:large subunit ribosomal protein L19|nr:50S ribosomal protein L19 [Caldisericia bacterium]HOJ16389.1 50S ribosomal protein L19 [Caldisericia bacterium]HPO28441.1 50S ribosomal protein L19 [Caldisericia bacterium]HQG82072.1 50S ribosomal protein L19 [Caldisericia bacterium]HXK69677.1 50S ribosomal protein L19 [Caldisericia bacterium]